MCWKAQDDSATIGIPVLKWKITRESNANHDRVLEEPWTKEVGINTDAFDELSIFTATVAELEELSMLHQERCCNFTTFSTGSNCCWWFKTVLVYRVSTIVTFNGLLWFFGPAGTKFYCRDCTKVMQERGKGRPSYLVPKNECFLLYLRLVMLPTIEWTAQPHGDVVRPLWLFLTTHLSWPGLTLSLQLVSARMQTWQLL